MIWMERYTGAAGLLPEIFLSEDKRSYVEQANDRYAHGGGWNKFNGFTRMQDGAGNWVLQYPGDPPVRAIAMGVDAARRTMIELYEYSWVSIVQYATDGSMTFEVARMD